ncbi:MAG TPA: hypothetical protein VM492_13985 [Sumerlaeia bacterium]|nr:hypothetical protein [Sumerlaeia bacterium]
MGVIKGLFKVLLALALAVVALVLALRMARMAVTVVAFLISLLVLYILFRGIVALIRDRKGASGRAGAGSRDPELPREPFPGANRGVQESRRAFERLIQRIDNLETVLEDSAKK